MGREIKFRGLSIKENKWVYGMLFHNNKIVTEKVSYDSPLVEKGSPNYKYEYINVIPETVGQYTGLKDKTGVQIYEGDIISNYRGKRVVEYTPCDGIKLAIIYDEPLNGIPQTHEDFRYNNTSISSVIGNIHENPELLK